MGPGHEKQLQNPRTPRCFTAAESICFTHLDVFGQPVINLEHLLRKISDTNQYTRVEVDGTVTNVLVYIYIYKPCINLHFEDCAMYFDHGVFCRIQFKILNDID